MEEMIAEAQRLFDAHENSFERVLLSSRLLDDALTPMGWMLSLDAAYSIVLFVVCVEEAVSMRSRHHLSHWETYELIYFRMLNSTAVPSFFVSSVISCVLQRRHVWSDTYVRLSIALVFPAIVTHCLVGAAVFFPIVGVILCAGCAFEVWSRRSFASGKGSRLNVVALSCGLSPVSPLTSPSLWRSP